MTAAAGCAVATARVAGVAVAPCEAVTAGAGNVVVTAWAAGTGAARMASRMPPFAPAVLMVAELAPTTPAAALVAVATAIEQNVELKTSAISASAPAVAVVSADQVFPEASPANPPTIRLPTAAVVSVVVPVVPVALIRAVRVPSSGVDHCPVNAMMMPTERLVRLLHVHDVPVRPPDPTTAENTWNRPPVPAAPPIRVHPVGAVVVPDVAWSAMNASR